MSKGQTLQERIVAKIAVDQLSGCWIWTGAKYASGYGQIRIGGRADGVTRRAHRVSFEAFRGPIAEGLEMDHLCRVAACVNPWHLEPVTHAVNMARGAHAAKTHCPHGHPYDEVNTRINAKGSRECRACRNAYMRTYNLRRKAARP